MKLLNGRLKNKYASKGLLTFLGVFFLSCSSGDSSSPGIALVQPLGAPDQGGIGILVYRNHTTASVYNFNKQTTILIDPGEAPALSIGFSASKTGQLVTAQKGGNDGKDFFIVIYTSDGILIRRIGVKRLLSKLTSAIAIAADGKKIAFSIEEKIGEHSNQRIRRVVILDLETEVFVAQLDGFEFPLWIQNTDELVAREKSTGLLHVFDRGFMNKGVIGDFTVPDRIASYDISVDGRFVVWEDGLKIYAADRNKHIQWIAVEDKINVVYAPLFAPNGRLLALQGKKGMVYIPHIVPFVEGTTVNLEPDIHAISNDDLTSTDGKMGWFESDQD